ncbi:helix-turn-helix domain-containing protein [Nocardia nova]|uniref:helix-turn-helix domain-containing protein n=1 Tax=Nocardia nova TaxID=37330 RepID=UPI002738CEF1|nr:helix-turn-helix transcriptional regulator [Nocardia nova]
MAYEPAWSQRVAAKLTAAIDASPKTLQQLADETGIPLSTFFRRYKHGYKRKNAWDIEQIEALAEALDTDPDALMHSDEVAA